MSDSEKPQTQSPATGCVPTWDTTDPLQQEVTRILKSFKLDILGILNLGKDGVLRSLTADRKVLSAEAMSPQLITAFHSRFPQDFREQIEVEGIDGRHTAKGRWYQPDEGILPEPLSQERSDEVRNMSEEKKDRLRKRIEEDERLVDASGVLR
ncbi:uncharacterized protein K460DRAFT_375755 [Cucurbitaria berberidis CBS 394.84]|uniref:Uncharacterized protein n=1 Tax=Cucurbitaria berberidis CBS 394.84 TaxID=1168544 RepID=A0A9P4GMB7_9PLEO|nr:uncharacterized protein K460DRAFT_375755 [Cucurbitaria berberidis CBS 394.84]KAF1849028.1 hypothetical protein K460DRAFT_375755 [Cucurbitaria berberidis CBS 394.84]